ncbi:MAG: glucose-6-phosphate isomerase [Bacteriovoracaceae bacterium]
MLNIHLHSSVTAKAKPASSFESFLKTLTQNPEIGFFGLPQRTDLLQQSLAAYEKHKNKKVFIHIGIGGSALGPEMILRALVPEKMNQFILLNNIDPDDTKARLQNVKMKEAVIFVVSKSGTTAETVASMSIVLNLFHEQGLTEKDYSDHFVFCTDPVLGDFRKLGAEKNITCLDVPSNVGGRFSVLTPVGLFPALFAGVNVKELLQGAADYQEFVINPAKNKNFIELGNLLADLHNEHHVNQTVIMPYSSLLKEFSAWFVQLWAESLGKNGKGLTPIPAYGATDQHSQMQLFMEGPNDKMMVLIQVEKFKTDYSLNNSFDASSFNLLKTFSLSQLFQAEFVGSFKALQENKRHITHLSIKELTAYSLGQLILFSEALTVYMGELMKLDPFNQPGVEAGKKYAKEWLKTHGK